MRLWIDDERPAPEGWEWAKTSKEAIDILVNAALDAIVIDSISFDHDLGGDDTSRPVAMWLCEFGHWPKFVYIHTMNNVGREWLMGTCKRYAPAATIVKPGGITATN